MGLKYDSANKYICLKVTDKELADKTNLRLSVLYGDIIAQIPIISGNESFLFVHINTQAFLLEGRGYERVDNQEEARKVLEYFFD